MANISGRFIDGIKGRLLLLQYGVSDAPTVMIFHGFGDEMNKSRAQGAQVAARLAAAGYGVLVLDPYGTGDSEGEFADADISVWLDDYLAVCKEYRSTLSGFLGIRFGAALAARCAVELKLSQIASVYWQPDWSAVETVKRLLRSKSLAHMMKGKKVSVDSFVKLLQTGQTVEAGGYAISESMWRSAVRFDEQIVDFIDRWAGSGETIHVGRTDSGQSEKGHFVSGLPFWNASELAVLPELTDLTVKIMQKQTHAGNLVFS